MSVSRYIHTIKAIMFNTHYFHCYYKKPIQEKTILIESKAGSDLAGNMFYILKELCTPQYDDYKVYLTCSKSSREQLENKLAQYNINKCTLIMTKSKAYERILATAKYLFLDTSFARTFVKREGQIITNTWHGTPLKNMGKDVTNRIHAMGNVQRNLLCADYLIYPNDYMKEKMLSAYHLDKLFRGTILCEGYPRNSVFFDKEAGADIRRELGLEGKTVYIYMPTWRGTLDNKNTEQLIAMQDYYLIPLDGMLNDNQIIYVKQHPFVSKDVSYEGMKHIRPFPDKYDTYEFMNMCDGLITDYSSVFFDFANARKKIILFAYDETAYMSERGTYISLNELPFPIVKTAEKLAEEISKPKEYDDTEFLKRYCTYDGPGAAERICRQVIKGEQVCRCEKVAAGAKEKVIICGSAFVMNGLTVALVNLLNHLDLDKRDYFISFLESNLTKNPERLSIFEPYADKLGFLPISSDTAPTLFEFIACWFFFHRSKENTFIKKYKERMYDRELMKHYGDVHADCLIQFSGYDNKIITMFEQAKCRRVIFVHNDMVEELKNKNNQHELTLKRAYRKYDRVAAVTEDIVPSVVKISGRRDNVVVVNNCLAYKDIRERALVPVEFGKDTMGSVTQEELVEILENKELRKFISIGRFSKEKGHSMLMKAFEKYAIQYPDTCLIIIGGYGELFKQTMEYAKDSEARIYILKSVKNPMPVLKQCDLFILSSFYEGLGLTLLEADTLGIPTISTDVQGPRGFMKEHNGTLVPPTEEGLYQGMIGFTQGKIKAMNVDYEMYNRHAVEQFEDLFKN